MGLRKSVFFAADIEALDEFMGAMQFVCQKVDDKQDMRKYVRNDFINNDSILVLKKFLFEEDGRIKDIRSKAELEEGIVWIDGSDIDNDLPF